MRQELREKKKNNGIENVCLFRLLKIDCLT